MKEPTVKTRRIRITLFELDESLNKKGKKPLCELASFQASFALNSIPAASIVPLLGDNIKTKEKQVSLEKIYTLSTKNAPVGVYLNFLHSYSSKSSKAENPYWPKKEVCIFKGYLDVPTFTLSAYEVGMSLTIQHWLSSLAGISLLTTASSVHNPADIALQSYNLGTSANWGDFTLSETISVNKIWETGIKEIFIQVLNWVDGQINPVLNLGNANNNNNNQQQQQQQQKQANGHEDRLNPFVKLKRQRIRMLLNKIESVGTEINDKLIGSQIYLKNLIGRSLIKESYQSFINTCGWTKLIQVYSPTYLFSVVPQVDKVKIIPTPCTINKKKAIELTGKDVFQLSTRPYIANGVSRVVCTGDIGSTETSTPVGQPYYVNYGSYPPKGKEKEGLMVVLSYPDWICQVIGEPVSPTFPSVYEDPKEEVEKVKQKQKNVGDIMAAQTLVGQAFATYAYLVQAYNGTMATVSLPCRMDICPGAMVRVHIIGTKGGVDFYGTVAVVQVSLTAGATPGNTVLQLTNIRTVKDIDDPVDNPQTGAGYYKEQWSGQGEVLYGVEDNKTKDKNKNKTDSSDDNDEEGLLTEADKEFGVRVANLADEDDDNVTA